MRFKIADSVSLKILQTQNMQNYPDETLVILVVSRQFLLPNDSNLALFRMRIFLNWQFGIFWHIMKHLPAGAKCLMQGTQLVDYEGVQRIAF